MFFEGFSDCSEQEEENVVNINLSLWVLLLQNVVNRLDDDGIPLDNELKKLERIQDRIDRGQY